MPHPPPTVEVVNGISVVRDDLVLGGTKARVIPAVLVGGDEFVYASPVQGYAQVALAHCCRAVGKRATIFCAERVSEHPRTVEAKAAGATVVGVRPGYLTVSQCRAAEYCARTGAVLLPFGMDCDAVRNGLVDVARGLKMVPSEVWTVAGSGTLSKALQQAWPDAVFHAVQVGRALGWGCGRARVWVAPERFDDDAMSPPPFPSCGNYDAKAWRFIVEHATPSPSTLFWNVAG